MNDLPYWGIAAIKVWICTRELSYVQERLTGDAQRDEKHVWGVLAKFENGPLNLECEYRPEGWEKGSVLVSKEEADAELLAKPRSGELQAKGIKCDPFNKGNPVSDTVQYIPACDWAYFGIGCLPEGWEKRSLLVSQEEADAELLAKLRSGELQAKGIKCDPFNKGNPVSDTAQDIPVCDWAYFRIACLRHLPGDRYAAFYEHNDFPWWQHVVCLGATVRQLWPAEPGSAKPLNDRERAARTFLENDWIIKPGMKDPWRGAWSEAIRHVANACRCTADAAKKSTGGFIHDEICRLRKNRG